MKYTRRNSVISAHYLLEWEEFAREPVGTPRGTFN